MKKTSSIILNHILGLFCVLIFSQSLFADSNFKISIGSEYRPEKNTEGRMDQHYFRMLSFGFGKEKWLFVIEKSDFTESSGNATLSVERSYSHHMLWTQYSVGNMRIFDAYAGVGAGSFQESIATTLYGQRLVNDSAQQFISGAALGLRSHASVFFASAELRVLMAEQLNQRPSFGAALQGGLWF